MTMTLVRDPRTSLLNSLVGKPWAFSGPDAFSCYDLWRTVQWELFGFKVPEVDLPNVYNKFAAEKLIREHLDGWKEIAPDPILRQIVNPPDGCTVLMSGNERLHHIGTWLARESRILHIDTNVVMYPLSTMRQHWGTLKFMVHKA
jgi:hypothetical protein